MGGGGTKRPLNWQKAPSPFPSACLLKKCSCSLFVLHDKGIYKRRTTYHLYSPYLNRKTSVWTCSLQTLLTAINANAFTSQVKEKEALGPRAQPIFPVQPNYGLL